MQNVITVVYGQKGYGKTTLMERLVSPRQNVVVFDSLGSYQNMKPEEFKKRLPGFSRLRSLGSLERTLTSVPLGRWSPEPFRVVYIPQDGYLDGHLAALHGFIRRRWDKKMERTTLMVDEADLFNRGTSRSSGTIESIVKRGRHNLIDQLYATRRPAELPHIVSSQADHFYVLRIQDELDLKHLKNYFPKLLLPQFQQLQIGEYFHLDASKGTIGTNK